MRQRRTILFAGLIPLVIGLAAFSAINFWPRVTTPKLRGKVIAVYEDKFRLTFYYTPRESGFTAERGFDVEPSTRSGLAGRTYPREFLELVETEGFGRITEPHEGKSYIYHRGGEWGYADFPKDAGQTPLQAKVTCAISKNQPEIPPDALISLHNPSLPEEIQRIQWVPRDTGSGVEKWHIDAYWGEDDPLGPGAQRTQPKTAPKPPPLVTVVVRR